MQVFMNLMKMFLVLSTLSGLSLSAQASMKIDRPYSCRFEAALVDMDLVPNYDGSVRMKMYNLGVEWGTVGSDARYYREKLVYNREMRPQFMMSNRIDAYVDRSGKMRLSVGRGKPGYPVFASLEVYDGKNSRFPEASYDDFDCVETR